MATKKTVANAAKEVEKVVKKVEAVVEEKKPAAEKVVKETTKKAAATAKKVVKKFEPKKTVVTIEANGKSFTYDDVVKAVTKACKGKTAKKLEIYVNANEGAAYYVLDGVAEENNKVEL